MTENNFPISAQQVNEQASQAVRGYIRSQFPKFFTAEDIEDLTGETVYRMWRARTTFDPQKGSLATWAGAIARNVVRAAAEAKWRRVGISAELEDGCYPEEGSAGAFRSDAYTADGALLLEERLQSLYAKLRSERDQRFLSWQIDGLDAQEMARREGIPVGRVYMVLFHMRERLRRAA